jgi:NAD(P)H-nitrite reductase large subunit
VGEIEGAWLGSPIERDERDQPLRYLDRRRRVYRKTILRDGRLVGALLLGDRRGEEGLRRMIEEGVDAEPLRRRLLDPEGDPLPDPRGAHVVCACLSITDEVIHASAANGAKTLEEISRATGIGSVCGTCLPEARLLLSSR